MKIYQHSVKGTAREQCEDDCLVIPSAGLFLIVDGVGKSSGAAKDVTDAFASIFSHLSLSESAAGSVSLLKEAFRRANAKLVARSRSEGTPCCAAALAVVACGKITVAWCGDCRLYQISALSKVSQVTSDHTRLAELIARGVISEGEVEPSMRKSALTRVLGDKDEVDCEIISNIKVSNGDVFFLCTDGVYNHLSSDEFGTFLKDVTAICEADSKSGGEDSSAAQNTAVDDRFKAYLRDKLAGADDDNSAIILIAEEGDEKLSSEGTDIDDSIDLVKSGLKSEITAIEVADRALQKKTKRRSVKRFLLSIPSMSKRELLVEGGILIATGAVVFWSPLLVEVAGQRMGDISAEYFVIFAIILYFAVLRLRLYLKN